MKGGCIHMVDVDTIAQALAPAVSELATERDLRRPRSVVRIPSP